MLCGSTHKKATLCRKASLRCFPGRILRACRLPCQLPEMDNLHQSVGEFTNQCLRVADRYIHAAQFHKELPGTPEPLQSIMTTVTAHQLTTGETVVYVLHARLQANDHAVPALMVLPNGRDLASYSKHGSDRFTRWRISERPGDASRSQPEQQFEHGVGVTYSKPLPPASRGAGRPHLQLHPRLALAPELHRLRRSSRKPADRRYRAAQLTTR